MKIKIAFLVLLSTIIGCKSRNSSTYKVQTNNTIMIKKNTSSKSKLVLIDSILGQRDKWCYIFGNRINDSIYSSIRILSQNKDTLYSIDKNILKNTKGIDIRAEFFAYKISSVNRNELIVIGVDSIFQAYGDEATVTWNNSKDVFETVKY